MSHNMSNAGYYSPLPFLTVRDEAWVVGGTLSSQDDYRESVLSVFRSRHPKDPLVIDRHPDFDGLVFDCHGDADWFKRQVGLIKAWRPDTEGR